MEKEIKFRYRFDRGELFEDVVKGAGERISTEIVTLEELEDGRFKNYYSNYKILSRDRFTGLLDKKGIEIYCGDVVEVSVMVYEKGGWRSKERERVVITISPERGTLFGNYGFGKCSKKEIIGNIHQSPEFLSQQE